MDDLQGFDGDGGNRTRERFLQKPEPATGTFVYFIQAGEDGPIKIGLAKDIPKRIALLQTGNAEELRLLGAIPGARKLERGLHGRLVAHQIRGEWFRPEPEVLMWACAAAAIRGRYSCEMADWQFAEDFRYEARRAGLWGRRKSLLKTLRVA